jgi:hypothetical protein
LSSYLQPYIRPDIYTRHPCQGYKYCENLYRRRSWDKHALAEDAKSTLKRVVNNYLSSHRRGIQGAGRFLNTHAASTKTPDNPEGVRPGHNIEDVERAPLEHLLFGDKKGQRADRKASSRLGHRKAAVSYRAEADCDYVIDPITNRKVPKKSDRAYSTSDQGVEIPIRRSKPYKSQFEPFRAPEVEPDQAPIFSDGPPPEAELRKYAQDMPWDPVAKSDQSSSHSGKTPVVNHNDASQPTLLDTLNWEHKDVRWHANDNIASAATESTASSWAQPQRAPEYPDLHHYTAMRHQEPDGKPSDEHMTQKYDDLHKYGAFKAEEPDGRYKIESESVETPQDLRRYEAVRSHEPDGKYNLGSESSAHLAELDEYDAVRSHEPDGLYAAEYTDAPDDAELASYRKPFLAHEPDGKYAANHVEPECDAAELAKYRQPFFSYEPDGKYAASYLEPQLDEAELSQYKAVRSHEPDGKYAASHVEEKPDLEELATYGAFRSHEPDGKYAQRDTVSEEPSEVHKYEAFRSHEPDGKYAAEAKAAMDAAEEDEDLANHEAFSYEDAETRPSQEETRSNDDAADLQGYKTMPHYEPDGPVEPASEYEDYDPAELRKYQAVRWNESDGKPAEAETASPTLFEYDVKGETPEDKTTFLKHVEELMAQAAAESDAIAKEALSGTQQPDNGNNGRDPKLRGLTGSYVRDFPEEFSKSWATDTMQGTSSLLSEEQKVSDSTIQPALERYSSHQTTAEPTDTSSFKPANPPSPALYKILVYDPTMQCIETAETTSIVPDSAAPLTPAEVLLRISNPAKFFPHFAPLQAQGFEIVSGSGDVLIFRKVREALPEGKEQQQPEDTAAGAGVSGSVNPIDMTGERRGDGYTVAAGRFASPTGFVNYNLPPATPATSTAGDRAGAEYREEWGAVGEENGEVGKKRRRKSLPKRVAVGAVWLAGLSYSLGVVSEYFKSGGVDGKGPRGL